jgi:hypothetical protein
MGVEAAAEMINAAGIGVTITLIGSQQAGRLADHAGLSENTREAVLSALVTQEEPTAPAETTRAARGARHAVALKALLDEAEDDRPFTPGEHLLLTEWLTRLAAGTTRGGTD